MSIVHSYFAYNSQRESALRDAQTKCKSLKSEKLNIEQKTKELTDAIVVGFFYIIFDLYMI